MTKDINVVGSGPVVVEVPVGKTITVTNNTNKPVQIKPVSVIVGKQTLPRPLLHPSMILVGGKESSRGAVARKIARKFNLNRVLTEPDFNRPPPKYDYVICVDDIHRAPANYKALMRINFKDAAALTAGT